MVVPAAANNADQSSRAVWAPLDWMFVGAYSVLPHQDNNRAQGFGRSGETSLG